MDISSSTMSSSTPTINDTNSSSKCMSADFTDGNEEIGKIIEKPYIEDLTEESIAINKKDENDSSTSEIPDSIKALDDIISEFDDKKEPLPPTTTSRGNLLQENQSEDDGYMSLNGRRCEPEVSVLNNKKMTLTETDIETKEVGGDAIIQKDSDGSVIQKDSDGSVVQKDSDASSKPLSSESTSSDCLEKDSNHSEELTSCLVQTTLPKSRPNAQGTTNYSSLPCSSLKSSSLNNAFRVGSCNGERNILGIDISAVHNAVLRGGVPKLPEPIVNEHPVTIYPGPPSSFNGNDRSSRSLTSAIQSHKDVCRKIVNTSELSTIPNYGENLHLPQKDEKTQSNVDIMDSPEKSKSIAWEINFKNFQKNQSGKQRVRNKYKNKSTGKEEKINQKKNTSRERNKNLYSGEKFEAFEKIKESSKSRKHKNAEEFYELSTDSVDFNPSIQGSMLGKGTFVIRKRHKDQPERSDLFLPAVVDSENVVNDKNSHECVDSAIAMVNHNSKNIVSSRARLSLDLDSDQRSPRLNDNPRNISHKDDIDLEFPYAHASVRQGLCSYSSATNFSVDPAEKRESQGSFDLPTSSSASNLTESGKKSIESFYKTDAGTGNGVTIHNNMKSANGLRSPGSNEHISSCTTPHRELAPPLEEEEEQFSESQSGCAPLRQIEHNISALLRGDIAVARIGEPLQTRRSLGYRPGVHKSESAKEMLLSQNAFGPLPPSPSSSTEINDDCDELPPLPPSPSGTDVDDNILDSEIISTSAEMHNSHRLSDDSNVGGGGGGGAQQTASKYLLKDLPLPPLPHEHLPPAVPPHRGFSHSQTIRSRSIDSNYNRKFSTTISHSGSAVIPMGHGTSSCDVAYTTKRTLGSFGPKRNLRQSPREEHRLQTSCSLPETPIFARGCDVPRTPHKRQTENSIGSGSRTAPRSNSAQIPTMGSSIMGISAGNTLGFGVCRQRTISHALASGEMLRLSGGPARGWYPKQRSMRPQSTENIDRLQTSHSGSMRVWDVAGGMTGTGQVRKPLTLPPNLTPSFLNKSPREALRRVTSLLINKKGNCKERESKVSKENMSHTVPSSNHGSSSISKSTLQESTPKQSNSSHKSQKKKGFFKQFWKKSKHYSLDQ